MYYSPLAEAQRAVDMLTRLSGKTHRRRGRKWGGGGGSGEEEEEAWPDGRGVQTLQSYYSLRAQ